LGRSAILPDPHPWSFGLVQQDYLWTGWNGWIHITMEHFADHFEIVEHTEYNSVVFLYTNEIPPDRIPDNLVGGMARSRVIELQDQAIARFDGKQKEVLLQSRENLHSMLNLWAE